MLRAIASLAAILAAFTLGACGGGGGSGPTQSELRMSADNIIANTDTGDFQYLELASDAGSLPALPGATLADFARIYYGERRTHNDPHFLTPASEEFVYTSSRHSSGVTLAYADTSGPTPSPETFDGEYTAFAYMGLLEDSMFIVTGNVKGTPKQEYANFLDDPNALSMGKPSGSRPTTAGTWNGVAVAFNDFCCPDIDVDARRVEGEVTITLENLSDQSVTIAFDNWQSQGETPDKSIPNTGPTFNNVPISSGGLFLHNGEGITGEGWQSSGRVHGQFYGANHGEAGGVFQFSAVETDTSQIRLKGAFGARKE